MCHFLCDGWQLTRITYLHCKCIDREREESRMNWTFNLYLWKLPLKGRRDKWSIVLSKSLVKCSNWRVLFASSLKSNCNFSSFTFTFIFSIVNSIVNYRNHMRCKLGYLGKCIQLFILLLLVTVIFLAFLLKSTITITTTFSSKDVLQYGSKFTQFKLGKWRKSHHDDDKESEGGVKKEVTWKMIFFSWSTGHSKYIQSGGGFENFHERI